MGLLLGIQRKTNEPEKEISGLVPILSKKQKISNRNENPGFFWNIWKKRLRKTSVHILQPQLPTVFSWSEVEKHNKPDDGWTVINGKVYNVTKFLRIHTGGENNIIRALGKDGTVRFTNLKVHPPLAHI